MSFTRWLLYGTETWSDRQAKNRIDSGEKGTSGERLVRRRDTAQARRKEKRDMKKEANRGKFFYWE